MINKIFLIIGLLLISTTNAQETLSKKEQLIQDIQEYISGLEKVILFAKSRLEISLDVPT